jgi:acid phosphatase type 7
VLDNDEAEIVGDGSGDDPVTQPGQPAPGERPDPPRPARNRAPAVVALAVGALLLTAVLSSGLTFLITRDDTGTVAATATASPLLQQGVSGEAPLATRNPPVPADSRTPDPGRTPDAVTPSPTPSPHLQTIVLTIEPSADASVSRDAPDSNHGDGDVLEVDGDPRKLAFVRFDLTDVAGTIVSARLRLHSTGTSPSGGRVVMIDDHRWSEASITYEDRPSSQGIVVARIGSVEAGRIYEVDVTPAVTGGGPVTLVITSLHSDGADYGSRESATPPQLILETVVGLTDMIDREDSPLTVMAVGDIACEPDHWNFNGGEGTDDGCRQKHTAAIVAGHDPDAVLILGDSQYIGGEIDEYAGSYDLSWGEFWDRTYPVPGNHEYIASNANGYFDYFGIRAGDRDTGYYAFTRGGWLFIAINSNCSVVGGCDEDSLQYAWLEETLSQYPGSCQVAFMHHPLWSSTDKGVDHGLRPLYELMYAHGVDIVLAGHSHSYERFAPQDPYGNLDEDRGLRLFVVGTGGANLHEFIDFLPNSASRNDHTYGVLKLVFSGDSYRWEFLPEEGRVYTDTGSGSCR